MSTTLIIVLLLANLVFESDGFTAGIGRISKKRLVNKLVSIKSFSLRSVASIISNYVCARLNLSALA